MASRSVAAGLALGVLLDELFGDPQRWHPVAGFGSAATMLERRAYADDLTRGAAFALALLAPATALAVLAERGARPRPSAHTALVALVTWTVLGGASLRRTATELGTALERGDDAGARDLLPSLCGRDPESLDADGLARATVESLAENTSDAAVAPLFWGAVAGVPGLVAYRAVNTLDAMVGHRSSRYARFGTASARLDDLANLAPARLCGLATLLAAPVVHGDVRAGWRAWRRDAHRHPSPNAGVCEASAAGVLGLAVGGPTVYGGRVDDRPRLGDGAAPTAKDVPRAAALSRATELIALLLVVVGSSRRERK